MDPDRADGSHAHRGRDDVGRTAGKDVALVQGRDVYVSTLQAKNRIAIANAPLVFVGYGIAASERQWDDFKGVDLKGKVAVSWSTIPISKPWPESRPKGSSVAGE